VIPKPKHLSTNYAVQFKDESIVAAYQYRPPYPDEVFAILTGLLSYKPARVLDAGCGMGNIARRLAGMVDGVDAVDFSR
jgi:2-polyprenyl-3-methyl-5-hydroxy-6-metoxy-1,4-benzoquinol methylase